MRNMKNAEFDAMISIIIPAFNESETILKVLERIAKLSFKHEVIVVDDGSTDSSNAILKENFNLYDILCENRVNRGKGYSIKKGLKVSSGDIVVIQDADLEYYPEEISGLLLPIIAGQADVVYGSRFLKKVKMKSIPRLLANKLINLTVRILYGKNITDEASGYKVFRKGILESLNLKYDGFEMECEITAKIFKFNYRFCEIPISYTPRKVEESKIHWIDAIYAFFVLFSERLKK
ncbi:glycosyltransferase family 2 protein [bacterium]|nr:glycosyltransferase family 2 protein [bacterium]